MTRTLEHIKRNKIVAIMRGLEDQFVLPVARALRDGGITTIEVTANHPRFLQHISWLTKEFHDEVVVGAGTILDPETAEAAISAGAKFILSPSLNKETIRMAKCYGTVSIPGALAPTEILTAVEYGADIVKVFPASAFGPDYVKDIHGPLPNIPLMPTGGVELNNIEEYLKKGAAAVGIGSSLVNSKRIRSDQDLQLLAETALQFVVKVQSFMKEMRP